MWGTKSVEFEWFWNQVVLSLWSSGREVALIKEGYPVGYKHGKKIGSVITRPGVAGAVLEKVLVLTLLINNNLSDSFLPKSLYIY